MEDMPPGFRFYPTEEELISFYLHNKLEGTREGLNNLMNRVIPVVDIYEFNPWDLPQFSVYLCHKDPEQWFFFIERKKSEAQGARAKRLTTSGYWKATGSPGYVYSSINGRPIGEKRTMVFYNGRAPSGKKTEWKMNEYKAFQEEALSANGGGGAPPALRQEFSLCRIYKKSKCLRSFDRRPSPGVLHIGEPVPRQGYGFGVVGKSHQSTEIADRTTKANTSSLGSSSSGDYHANWPTQTREESNDSKMAVVDECSFLDLDGFWDPVN